MSERSRSARGRKGIEPQRTQRAMDCQCMLIQMDSTASICIYLRFPSEPVIATSSHESDLRKPSGTSARQ